MFCGIIYFVINFELFYLFFDNAWFVFQNPHPIENTELEVLPDEDPLN